MRAVVRDGSRTPAVDVREVEEPQPGPGETLVDVRASSLNRGELMLLAHRPDGWRPGQDVAGVVVRAAADGTGPAEGERVVGLAEAGGWSERVAVPTHRLAVLPPGVPFEQAATLPVAGLTALRTLRLAGSLIGRRVLVTGASGGVGHLAIQLAANAGAQVTALVTDASAHADLAGFGAGRVIDRHDDSDGQFDLVLEGLGGPSLRSSVGVVAPGGLIVVYGAVTPEPAPLSLFDFFGHEGATIHAFFAFSAAPEEATGPDLATLARLVDGGQLRPGIATVVDFEKPAEAVAALVARRVRGKVVLAR